MRIGRRTDDPVHLRQLTPDLETAIARAVPAMLREEAETVRQGLAVPRSRRT